MSVRAQIQKTVDDNGGEYTGDLTKDVTHLIAFQPQGMKYAYATQWQKKVVGMKWLNESLERGMQLDEAKYHPMLPESKQGLGAWNRAAKASATKRPRDDSHEAEPPRKLRRTASARLGSQNDSIWGDIASGSGPGFAPNRPETLRPSISMPVMGGPVVNGDATIGRMDSRRGSTQQSFLTDKTFFVYGFDKKKKDVLENIIFDRGGFIGQLDMSHDIDYRDSSNILIVPHETSRSSLQSLAPLMTFTTVVSEMWIELCMDKKSYIEPASYPPANLLHSYPAEQIPYAAINCSGFTGIEALHLKKKITLMGAKYEEVFRSTTSILVCKNFALSAEKIRHAKEWNITVVSYEWIWSCFSQSRFVPVGAFVLIPPQQRISVQQALPGSDFREEVPPLPKIGQHDEQATLPLQEIPNNTKPLPHRPSPIKKKPLFKTFDGPASSDNTQDTTSTVDIHLSAPSDQVERKEPPVLDAQALNGAIQDLLNMKSKTKLTRTGSTSNHTDSKRNLLSRAISNVSNSSISPSKTRLSRASSIDSINTDGLGSEITLSGVGESGATKRTDSQPRISFNFTGRAKQSAMSTTRDDDSAGAAVQPITTVHETDPYYGHDSAFEEHVAEPPRTQLGYEGTDEAIKLREKLDQKQGKRSRDQSQPKDGTSGMGTRNRIKDDDTTIAAASTGAISRRTRGREKDISPPGLKKF